MSRPRTAGVSLLVIGPAMGRQLGVDPVLFFVGHTAPTGNLSSGSRPISRTRLGAVAERLEPVSLLIGIPLVDDDLNGHPRTPDAAGTGSRVVRSLEKAAVTPFAIGLDRRCWSVPRRRGTYGPLPALDRETAHLVEVSRFHSRIYYRASLSASRLAYLELVLLLGDLAHAEPRFAWFPRDAAPDAKSVPQVHMMTLIEGPKQAEAGLHRSNLALPLDLHLTTVGAA